MENAECRMLNAKGELRKPKSAPSSGVSWKISNLQLKAAGVFLRSLPVCTDVALGQPGGIAEMVQRLPSG